MRETSESVSLMMKRFILKKKENNYNVNKNEKHLIGLSNKNKRAQIFIGLANADANNVISPWSFLESDQHFALTSF